MNTEFKSYYRHRELRHTRANFWTSSLPPVITKLWKSMSSCKAQAAPAVLGMPITTPHCGLEPPSHPCSGQKPRETRDTPTSLPTEALFCCLFSEEAQDGLPCGASHAMHFFPAEAACDSAPAAAEAFANYLVIRTLAPKVVNLLASPAETVKVKTVSLAFQATALISKTEDN